MNDWIKRRLARLEGHLAPREAVPTLTDFYGSIASGQDPASLPMYRKFYPGTTSTPAAEGISQ